MVCKWQVEIDLFCHEVLVKHWPDVPKFGDIRDVGKHNLEAVDIICGGFPCQPFSNAGKRRGKTDNRFLWPEMFRVIQELSPCWVIGENVTGFINMELENTFIDLETEGYKVEAFVLPINAIGLPHRRDRIWIIANANGKRFNIAHEDAEQEGEYLHGQDRKAKKENDEWEKCIVGINPIDLMSVWKTGDSRVCRADDGVSSRVDRNRIKVLGNAASPQIVEIIGRYIQLLEELMKEGK